MSITKDIYGIDKKKKKKGGCFIWKLHLKLMFEFYFSLHCTKATCPFFDVVLK